MGLSIQVGLLAYLIDNDSDGAAWLGEEMASVNEVLIEKGLPMHYEPEQLNLPSPSSWGFPYSWIHHLRRFYARSIADPDWVPAPTPVNEDPTEDEVLDAETYMFVSHLLCHSDCGGFYLPIDFEQIIIDERKLDRIPGGILGSSYRLRAELIEIAPKLGVTLTSEGRLDPAEAARVEAETESEQGLWLERIVWLSLFAAAELSIEYRTAICFN